jgi:hypothetical protein
VKKFRAVGEASRSAWNSGQASLEGIGLPTLGRCAFGWLTGTILESRMPRFPLENGW